jgi:hypothetical protein
VQALVILAVIVAAPTCVVRGVARLRLMNRGYHPNSIGPHVIADRSCHSVPCSHVYSKATTPQHSRGLVSEISCDEHQTVARTNRDHSGVF